MHTHIYTYTHILALSLSLSLSLSHTHTHTNTHTHTHTRTRTQITLQLVQLDELDKGNLKLAFTASDASAWPGEYLPGLGMLDIVSVESVCSYHSGIHCSAVRVRKRPPAAPQCATCCIVPGCRSSCALRAGHSPHIRCYCGETACTAICSVPHCNRPCSHDHWHTLEGRLGAGGSQVVL